MSFNPSISICSSMDLSRTQLPVISTARIFPRRFSRFGINIATISVPTKNICKSKRCSNSLNHFPPLSELHSYQSSLNLFYQPKSRLPYGRKVIPSAKANGNQIGPDKSALVKVLKFSEIVLRVLRPPVVFGYIVAFTGVMTRTWMENVHLVTTPKWILLLRAMALVVTIVCATCFVNGINQIYDIEIDKINKPHYPLASGELSLQSAWILVTCSAAIAIGIPTLLQSNLLLASIVSILVLASLYSIPPFSLKRSTIGAALAAATGRLMLTLGIAAASRNIMGLPFQLSLPVMFITIFSTLFTLALGALKDIEDLEGDKIYDVQTLASIYGPRKVAFFGIGLLLLTYGGAIATFTLMPQVFRNSVMVPTHVILAAFLIIQAWKWDKANYSKEVSLPVYESLWKFVTIEFILFPFM